MHYATTASLDAEAADPHSLAGRVRRDRAVIEALLDDVERASRGAQARRDCAVEQLRRAAWDLYITFDERLALEEAEIVPRLRALDAWGQSCAINMLLEHNEHRRIILQLVSDAEEAPLEVDGLVARADALVHTLRTELAVEDHSLDDVLSEGCFTAERQEEES